jgi:hypothetical protein
MTIGSEFVDTAWQVHASNVRCPTGSVVQSPKAPGPRRPSPQAPEELWTKDGEDLSFGANWEVQLCRSSLVCIHLRRVNPGAPEPPEAPQGHCACSWQTSAA